MMPKALTHWGLLFSSPPHVSTWYHPNLALPREDRGDYKIHTVILANPLKKNKIIGLERSLKH